jgi:tyrosyl-tRNA synthetase
MFGKIMSIPDELMWSYYELVTDRSPEQIATLKQEVASGALHPMDAKMRLGEEVVSDFHGPDPARKAAENFQRVFRDRQAPTEMQEIRLRYAPGVLRVLFPTEWDSKSFLLPIKWSTLLAHLQQVASVSEMERIIKQRGFEVNGEPVIDPTTKLNPTGPVSYEIRLGKKKFLRLIVE